MILKTDCKHFPGDRPCLPNKLEGIKCDNCSYYEPVGFKILIIKLDAVGDVLRTTSILHALKKKYPSSHITWLTRSDAKELFNWNNLVDTVLLFEDMDTTARLTSEHFDLLIHPDASPVSSALASASNSKVKKGFLLDTKGKITPANESAIEWLEMGAFDEYKKRNTKTYQQILHEIAELEYDKGEIILNLSEDEMSLREKLFESYGLQKYKFIIGLNTGASKRWRLKQWRFEGFRELIKKLKSYEDLAVLLYGGPSEKERNNSLKNEFANVVDTGSDNSLREFFVKLDLSQLIITGDTLALHAATALKKHVICLFGPTSSNEIESYGRIIKIIPDMDCLVCYKPECDFVPNCMDNISADQILNKIVETLRLK
jgi:heptosyltransferase-2